MALKVVPTKGNLIAMKKSLQLANLGYNLMDQKRNVLIKEMMTLLNTLKVADKKVLFVVDDFTENVILASRNIPNVALIAANELNVLDLVNSDVVVFTSEAIKKIEEALK